MWGKVAPSDDSPGDDARQTYNPLVQQEGERTNRVAAVSFGSEPPGKGRPIEAHTMGDAGAYIAVLAAALGRVSFTVERRHGGKDGTGKGVKIHPFFMWVIAIPLFIVQISCVFSLRFDLDVLKPVDEIEIARDKSETLNDLTRTLKLLMVLILQITQFSEMAQTLRFLVFVINPLTWIEISHPTKDEWLPKDSKEWQKIFFHPAFLVPWPILALLMRFIVGYLVCVDSVSLILSAKGVAEAIFNSLALTFVVDLNKAWKLVSSIVFHLKMDDDALWLNDWNKVLQATDPGDGQMNDIAREEGRSWAFWTQVLGSLVGFVLGATTGGEVWRRHYPIEWWGVGALAAGLLSGVTIFLWNEVTRFNHDQLQKWFGDEKKCTSGLRRGIGARTVEGILAGFALALIYMQQAMVVLFAYKTNILPVARDVCTQYRWLHHKATYFQAVAVWFRWFERLIPVNAHSATMDAYNRMLNNATNKATFRSDPSVRFANGTTVHVKQTLGCDLGPLHPYGDFYRMTMSDRWELFWDHPETFVIGGICLMLLLVSHTSLLIHSRFFHMDEGDAATTNKELRRSLTKLESQLKESQTQQRQCQESLNEQQKKIEGLEKWVEQKKIE